MLKICGRKPSNSSTAALAFERFCVESYIYYSAILMLFYADFDPLNDESSLRAFDEYFSNVSYGPHGLSPSQPVLGTSYRWFLLLAEITRLARQRYPSPMTWNTLHDNLCSCDDLVGRTLTQRLSNLDGALYILGCQALLECCNPFHSLAEREAVLQRPLQEAIELIEHVPHGTKYRPYHLWPLTVISVLAVEDKSRQIFHRILSQLSREHNGGPTQAVQTRIEEVWAINTSSITHSSTYGILLLLNDKSVYDCQ